MLRYRVYLYEFSGGRHQFYTHATYFHKVAEFQDILDLSEKVSQLVRAQVGVRYGFQRLAQKCQHRAAFDGGVGAFQGHHTRFISLYLDKRFVQFVGRHREHRHAVGGHQHRRGHHLGQNVDELHLLVGLRLVVGSLAVSGDRRAQRRPQPGVVQQVLQHVPRGHRDQFPVLVRIVHFLQSVPEFRLHQIQTRVELNRGIFRVRFFRRRPHRIRRVLEQDVKQPVIILTGTRVRGVAVLAYQLHFFLRLIRRLSFVHVTFT